MARMREFDEDALLDAAVQEFWDHGYTRTSLAGISRRSGVGNGSLYAAYGSKRALFLVAFERYCRRRVDLVRLAVDSADPRHVAERFLDAMIADCMSSTDRRGCLLLNSMGELASADPDVLRIGSDATRGMEDAVAEGLARAAGASAVELSAAAAYLVLVAQGLIQLRRAGESRARLREVADTALATWAAPRS